MVRFQSMSATRFGRAVRAERSSAPETAALIRCSRRPSSSATTDLTTARADSLAWAGITLFRLSRVATRWTSGSTAASSSGSSSSLVRSRRSRASRCMTWTTLTGKYVLMSPSQRATLGADAPRPAPPSGGSPYTALSAASIRASPPPSASPVPSASPPSASRHLRRRSLIGSPQDPQHRLYGGRGPRLVHLPARLAALAARRADLGADRPAFGRGEPAEGTAQQRQHLDELLLLQPREPGVDQRQQLRVVHQQQAAARQEGLGPGRRPDRGVPARHRPGHPRAGLAGVEFARV